MPTVNQWKTKTVNVDGETGEVLTHTEGYFKYKTTKQTKIENYEHKTIGYITWTNEYRRKLFQIEIPFPDDE